MADKDSSGGLIFLVLAYCMALLSGAALYYAIYSTLLIHGKDLMTKFQGQDGNQS